MIRRSQVISIVYAIYLCGITASIGINSALAQATLNAAAQVERAAGEQANVLKDHPGYWLGEIHKPNGSTIKIGVDVFTRADGSPWASYAQPDQGIFDRPVKSAKQENESVELDLSFATLTLTWDRDHFRGEMRQGSRPARVFDLKKVNAFPKKPRPQTPTAPFPYRDETLAIPSADGVVLGATLSAPVGIVRPNAVILIHGSGPQNRDQSDGGHEPFAVLADQLARQGIAVLRYDKRGIGRSTGDYFEHNGDQLADDAWAAMRAMRARKQFNKIGFIGHSEGPGIAAKVAARHSNEVDFLVSLAGVGLPGLDMMLLQDYATALANGAKPTEANTIVAYSRQFYDIILRNSDVEARMVELRALEANRPLQEKTMAERYKMNEGTLSLQMAETPMLRGILMADTTKDWRSVRCPVLVLNGSLDQQVPVPSLHGILAALRAGGNRKVTSAILPSINHALQTARTGAEDEYDAIDETVAPVVLRKISRFVLALR